MPGLLVIITGPTAAGKDELMRQLLLKNPDFSRIITTTTRSPRLREIPDSDFYFITKEKFQELIKKNQFFETNEYAGNFYGTTTQEFDKLKQKSVVLWRIDATMAAKAKKNFPNSIIIYLTTNLKTLRLRLKQRGMTSGDIKKRIDQDDQNWLNLKSYFKNVIINEQGHLPETIEKAEKIIWQAKQIT